MKRLMRFPEVAERLDVSVTRAYELARTGELPVVRLGPRQLRVDPERLEEWLREGGTENGPTQTPAGEV